MTTSEVNTRDRIRQKADELYNKYGIRSVSMDDIANALGMSKKTIYQYFSDKNDLVQAVVEFTLEDMRQNCVRCLEGSKDAVHEIFLTMEHILDEFANMNPIIVYDLEKFHVRAYQLFMEHKNKYLYQIIRTNLERGIREGLYRDDVSVDVLTRFRLDSMMLAFNIDIFPPGRFNLAEVTQVIIEHFVFGLSSTKGHKLILKYKEERIKAKHYDTLPGSKAK